MTLPAAGPRSDLRREADGSAPLLAPAVKRALPLFVAATVVWVGGLGLAVAGRNGFVGPDGPVGRAVSSLGGTANRAAQAVATMSRPSHVVVLVVVILALCALARSGRAAIVFVVSTALSALTVDAVKELVRRREILPDYQVVGGYTFPSGHVAVAAVLATVAILVCRRGGPAGRRLSPRWRRAVVVAAAFLVAVVAASMINLRDHYFIDTIAAVPLGMTVTLLVAAVVDTWAGRHQ